MSWLSCLLDSPAGLLAPLGKRWPHFRYILTVSGPRQWVKGRSHRAPAYNNGHCPKGAGPTTENTMNNVQLIGNLGVDPELRYTQAGTAVANFSVATNKKWRDEDGELQERVDWHQIVVYGKAAEQHNAYLKKGSKVGISGELRCDSWQDDEGNNRKSVRILARRIDYLSSVRTEDEDAADQTDEFPTFNDDDIPF